MILCYTFGKGWYKITKKRIFPIILEGFIFSLIPALFTLLGTTNAIDYLKNAKYLGESVDIEKLKFVFSVISILITFVLVTVKLSYDEYVLQKYKERSSHLLVFNKYILSNTLAEYFHLDDCEINIRIFVPYKTIYWRLFHKINNLPLMFAIKNVEGLAEAGTTNELKFQVEPYNNQQGLVGKCYNKRNIIYDDNLQETNKTDYNLTDFQKSKTNDLKFIMACPVFDNKEKVIAVVSFDSKQNLKIKNNSDKIIKIFLNYVLLLQKHVPELFK